MAQGNVLLVVEHQPMVAKPGRITSVGRILVAPVERVASTPLGQGNVIQLELNYTD